MALVSLNQIAMAKRAKEGFIQYSISNNIYSVHNNKIKSTNLGTQKKKSLFLNSRNKSNRIAYDS